MAIGIVFLPSEPDQLIYKIMVSIFFGVLGLFFIFLLFVIKKNKAKALQINEYSPIAIYYKNKSIFIDEGEVVEIKCEDIKKVKVSHNTKTVSYGIAQETTILPDGSITVVTKDKKKHVALQIKNIDSVKDNIEYFTNAKKYDVNQDISLVLDKQNYFSGHYKYKNRDFYINISNSDDQAATDYSAKTLREFIRNFDNIYEKVVANTSKDLLNDVKEWNDDDESVQNMTEEDLANIIKASGLTIFVDGKDYLLYFSLGDLLYDHQVRYNASIEDDKYMVSIEG